MKRSIVKLAPQVESTRMLREYVEDLYEPAAEHTERMTADDFGPDPLAGALVPPPRPGVVVGGHRRHQRRGEGGRVGRLRRSSAQVLLGDLDPTDVEVQAIYGEVDLDNDLLEPTIASMALVGDGDHPGWRRYRLDIEVPRAGSFGATFRVVPRHDDVETYVQLGHVAWAPSMG